MSYSKTQRGISLIEVLVASAVITVSLAALTSLVQVSSRILSESVKKAQAQSLAGEGIEAVRIMRDAGWSVNVVLLATSTPYYPVFSTTTSAWTLTATNPGAVDGVFTRTIVFHDVYRRVSDSDIVASTSPDTKAIDVGTREVVSLVTWGSRSVSFSAYLSNLFSN